ncbi:hypothetical protein Trydic_g11648 [Trypoxylus dichotomus]
MACIHYIRLYRLLALLLTSAPVEMEEAQVPHFDEIPVPVYEELSSLEYSDAGYMSDAMEEQDSHVNSDNEYMIANDGPQCFTQADLNDLVRDLGLSKKSSKVLGFQD